MKGKDDILPGTFISAGEPKVLRIPIEPELLALIREMDENQRAVPQSTTTRQILCVGDIKYRDDIGIERFTGIYRTYNPRTGRFKPNEDADLEYSD